MGFMANKIKNLQDKIDSIKNNGIQLSNNDFIDNIAHNRLYGEDGKQVKVEVTAEKSDGTLKEVRVGEQKLDNSTIKVIKKSQKDFQNQLLKYDKSFAEYASMDISKETTAAYNHMYNKGKLNLFGKALERGLTPDEIVKTSGDEGLAAIAGNEKLTDMAGVTPSKKSMLAAAFEPYIQKFAEKHPHFQKVSDAVTKAANEGRMPLTADSAAMMRIAFDKKYYNDMRAPGANKEELTEQYKAAVENLGKMAELDGISKDKLSETYTKKLMQQLPYDNSLADTYKGISTGAVRVKEIRDEKTGNTRGYEFLTGNDNHAMNAWDDLTVREPYTWKELMNEYSNAMTFQAGRSHNRQELGANTVTSVDAQNISKNLEELAKADNIFNRERFEHDKNRVMNDIYDNWAIAKGDKELHTACQNRYPAYDDIVKNNEYEIVFDTVEEREQERYDTLSNGTEMDKEMYNLANPDSAIKINKDDIEKDVLIDAEERAKFMEYSTALAGLTNEELGRYAVEMARQREIEIAAAKITNSYLQNEAKERYSEAEIADMKEDYVKNATAFENDTRIMNEAIEDALKKNAEKEGTKPMSLIDAQMAALKADMESTYGSSGQTILEVKQADIENMRIEAAQRAAQHGTMFDAKDMETMFGDAGKNVSIARDEVQDVIGKDEVVKESAEISKDESVTEPKTVEPVNEKPAVEPEVTAVKNEAETVDTAPTRKSDRYAAVAVGKTDDESTKGKDDDQFDVG